MNITFLLRRLLFCCLMILGTAGVTLAQFLPVFGIKGAGLVCQGNTQPYTANGIEIFGAPLTFTWTITPASAGTIVSTTNNTVNLQWNTPGTAVITATSSFGEVFTKTVTIGAIPAPVITSTVQLACQPLGEDPKKEAVRIGETECQWVCENSPVLYTVTGTAGSTYTWTVSGTANPPVTYNNTCTVYWGAAGNGMVTVTETTTAGCKATKTFCVKIISGPSAKFDAPFAYSDPIEICTGGQLVLNDHSSGTTESPIVSWHWDFGDGHVSNQSPGAANNPIVHQYDNPGDYVITLIVTNSCGCTSETARKVIVREGKSPVITCPRVVCEGDVIEYFVDQKCDPSNWDVEGGTILSATGNSATISWDHVDPATGFGYVKYTSCKDCKMTVAEPVPVVLQHVLIDGPTNICEGEQYVFRLPKWPTTKIDWSVNGIAATILQTDQPNEIVVIPNGTGTMTLSCNYTNTLLSCGGTAEITLHVNPKANITGKNLLCKDQTDTYTLGGYTATWTLTDPTGTIVGIPPTGTSYTPPAFTQEGIYTLNVYGTTFCPVSDYYITVKALPAAPFIITGPDGVCTGVPVKYTAGPLVPGTTFQWSVTNGSTNGVTGIESYITFNTVPNLVSVKRITTDAAQCASPALTKVVVDPVPVLHVSGPDTVCHSTTQTYGVNYLSGDSYEWNIVPANLGSVINPNAGGFGNPSGGIVSVLWNVPQIPPSGQVATLYVKVKKCNTYRTDSIKVFVRGIPSFIAKLSSGLPDTTVCSGTPVTLQLIPNYPVTSADSVFWQWGDGSQTFMGPGIATQYTHTFAINTSGQVSFLPVATIKNANGCFGTAIAKAPKINVKPTPVAFITPEGPIAQCDPVFSQPLTATITSGIGGSNSFSWTPSAPNQPTIIATALGFYSVVVSNSNGCSATSNVVQIKKGCPMEPCGPGPSPAIVLTGSNICGNVNVHAAISGPSIKFDWFYPSSTTLVGTPTATDLNATFAQAGMYQFDYFAYYKNNIGDTCVVDSAITVLVPYMAGLRYEIGCNQAGGNYAVTLADRSSLYPGINVTRTYYNSSWVNIGSGLSVTTNVAGGTTNTYYMVIQDASMTHPACTASVVIKLPDYPVADFGLENNGHGCVGNAFNFWNMSIGGPLTYLWDYGTAQSQGATGGVVYASPVTNNPVTLTVIDQYGCGSSKTQLVTAHSNPYTGLATAAPNPACFGTAVNVAYVPSSGSAYPSDLYTWYLGNSPVFSDFHANLSPNFSHGITEPGGYWIKATGEYGCTVKTNTVPVVINQLPLISIYGSPKQCANIQFTLTTDSVPGATYLWGAPGMLIPTASPKLVQNISSAGSYSYTVTVIINNCSRTSGIFTVDVNAQPAPPVVSFNVDSCQPYQVTLSASGPTGAYNWSNGDFGQTVITYQGGLYNVTYLDDNGCKSTNEIRVPKDPNEYLWIFPKGCFCNIRFKTYIMGPIIPFEGWAWLQDGGAVNSGTGMMPDYFPSPGHSHNMYLNNGYCEVTSEPMYYNNEGCKEISSINNAAKTMGASGFKLNTMLQLVPNPARETTNVLFVFTPDSHERYIEIYDMVGRKLQTHAITADRGELVLQMAQYGAGMYQVIMKENGITVQQSKLSLTR